MLSMRAGGMPRTYTSGLLFKEVQRFNGDRPWAFETLDAYFTELLHILNIMLVSRQLCILLPVEYVLDDHGKSTETN